MSLKTTTAPTEWPDWNNPSIVLFHGTTRNAARNVMKAVDLAHGDPETDFGKGFYTTTWENQAREWAKGKASEPGCTQSAAVVRLTIDRLALGRLDTLAFVRGAKSALDYWNFVAHCRQGLQHFAPGHTSGRGYYDVVYGPVAVRWENPMVCEVFTNFDQISFHTPDAERLLNSADCLKELLTW